MAKRKFRSVFLGGRTSAEHAYDTVRRAQKHETASRKRYERKGREYERRKNAGRGAAGTRTGCAIPALLMLVVVLVLRRK